MTDVNTCPLLEFEESRDLLIDAAEVMHGIDAIDRSIPRAVVFCYFADVVEDLVAQEEGTLLTTLIGGLRLYELPWRDQHVGLIYPAAGASLAGALLEEVVALGATDVIACGGAGALSDEAFSGVVIADSAVRDEGISYHYLPPAREVLLRPSVARALAARLDGGALSVTLGKVWSTDAVYRETRTKAAARRAEGCIAVDMECAGLASVAQYLNVDFGQLFYAWNSLAGATWQHEDYMAVRGQKELLLDAALDVALELATDGGRAGGPVGGGT